MPEVLFFILGALFCLTLVVALLAYAPASALGEAAQAMPGGEGSLHRPSAQAAPGRGRAQGAASSRPRLAPPPPPSSRGYHGQTARDDLRMAAARRALLSIRDGGEAAPAKVAGQTLRRLDGASEPFAARLAFARARLELLSLGAEPQARATARAALARIG